jgi:hypothetical protein
MSTINGQTAVIHTPAGKIITCPASKMNWASEEPTIFMEIERASPIQLSNGKFYITSHYGLKWHIFQGFSRSDYSAHSFLELRQARNGGHSTHQVRYETPVVKELNRVMLDAYLANQIPDAPRYDPVLVQEAHDLHAAYRDDSLKLKETAEKLGKTYRKDLADFQAKLAAQGITHRMSGEHLTVKFSK